MTAEELRADRERRGGALVALSRANVGGDEDDVTAAGDAVADLLHYLGPRGGAAALRLGLVHFLEEPRAPRTGREAVEALAAARDALR